jgi:hypothetical protein
VEALEKQGHRAFAMAAKSSSSSERQKRSKRLVYGNCLFCCSRVLWSCRQGSSLISRFLNSSYLEDVYAKKDDLRSLDKTFVLPKPVNFLSLSLKH